MVGGEAEMHCTMKYSDRCRTGVCVFTFMVFCCDSPYRGKRFASAEADRTGSGEGFNPCEKGCSVHVLAVQPPARHVHTAPLFSDDQGVRGESVEKAALETVGL